MKLNTFKGGSHPPELKDFTSEKKIINLSVPDKVFIPMLQHIGLPADPTVKPNDEVKCGTIIGEPSGFVSAYVHSSVSGSVCEIIDFFNIQGKKTKVVVINNDNKFENDTSVLDQHDDWSKLSSQDIVNIVERAGICGMGGATFPTKIKLSPSKKIDILLLNGAECEPYLNADNRLMIEHANEIVTGALIVQKALNAEKVIIGVENNKTEAIETLENESKKHLNVKIVRLQVKYPQGAEKQLIQATTGRKVPPNGLPMDIGLVVQNVGTVKAVYDAVVLGKPLFERVVTVAGDTVSDPQNLKIKIGTPLFYLKDIVGLDLSLTEKIILGGPMMGTAVDSLDYPVVKGTSGILFLSGKYYFPEEYKMCIRCSKCVSGCPMSLMPSEIGVLYQNKKFDTVKKYNISDCMECGSCSYICPSKRPLLQWIKAAKTEVKRIGN